MKRTAVEDSRFPACPVRNILSRLCDKWSLLVLYLLNRADTGRMRFGELKQAMPDISQKMLVTTLRTLEEDGYLTRRVYAEVPPRVEYALTARSETLRPQLEALLAWAAENMEAVMQDRRQARAAAAKQPKVENRETRANE